MTAQTDEFDSGFVNAEHTIRRSMKRRRDILVETPTAWQQLPGLVAATRVKGQHGHASVRCLVITSDPQRIAGFEQQIRRGSSGNDQISVLSLDPNVDARSQNGTTMSNPAVVISTPARLIDHIRRNNINVSAVSSCIVDAVRGDVAGHFSADLQFIYAKLDQTPVTTAFVEDLGQEYTLLGGVLRRPVSISTDELQDGANGPSRQGKRKERDMSDLPFDPSDLRERIADIVKEIHEEADPSELMAYRKYVRKYTSIFNRGYVMAYLVKNAIEGRTPKKKSSASRPSAEPNGDHQSVFVSVGRNRRIHSRDLITLFTGAEGITREDIGQIKVLDNYSFVEVAKEKAQAAVDKLNGQELGGRKLTVNFARKK